jgi:small GTP-binding protein
MKGKFMMIGLGTHGVDFVSRSFQLADGSVVNALIYDTGGQEQYKSINESYYKKASAILLVYDITNRKSFDDIKNYYCDKIKELCKKDIPIILLGNKTDMEDERQIPQEEGIGLALSNNYKFKETSCLKNENVADAFEALIELWNVEYQKKLASKTRRNSGDFTKKEKTLSRSNTVVNVKKNRLDTENESKTVTLQKGQIASPQRTSGCC